MNIRSVRGKAAVAVAALGVFAAGCGGGSEDAAAPGGDTGDSNGTLEESVDLTFATLDQGSAWYSYGVSISQELKGDFPSGSSVEVLPYSGSIGNPTLVSTGEADIATTFSAVAAWAYEGQEDTPFAGKPIENLCVLVGGLDQYYFGPIAPAGAEFDSIQEIVDQKMGVSLVSQPRGSLGDAGTRLILRAYGASVEDLESWGGDFEATSTDVATNAIRDGRADLWIQAITAGHPNITELAQTSDIKILDIDESVIEELGDLGLSPATLPGGTFRGQDEEAKLLGFKTALISSSELDEDVAYATTKSVIENAETLREANASMASFDPEQAAQTDSTGGVPLCAGAEAYYRDAGLLD